MTRKLKHNKDTMNICKTHGGKFTTLFKVKIEFSSATIIVAWKYHVYECTEGRDDMILYIYILLVLLIYI